MTTKRPAWSAALALILGLGIGLCCGTAPARAEGWILDKEKAGKSKKPRKEKAAKEKPAKPKKEKKEREGKWLFTFSLDLQYMTPDVWGLGIASVIDTPSTAAQTPDLLLSREAIDINFAPRFDPGFVLGAVAPNRRVKYSMVFFQYDQTFRTRVQALDSVDGLPNAPVIGSQAIGFTHIPDTAYFPIDLDATATLSPFELDQQFGMGLDLDGDLMPDLIPFQSGTEVNSRVSLDTKFWDLKVSYLLKSGSRFKGEWDFGLRYQKIAQKINLRYVKDDFFYVDGDVDFSLDQVDNSDPSVMIPDGEIDAASVQPLRSEDRIDAVVSSDALGLRTAFSGNFRLTKKWSVFSKVGVSALWGDRKAVLQEGMTLQSPDENGDFGDSFGHGDADADHTTDLQSLPSPGLINPATCAGNRVPAAPPSWWVGPWADTNGNGTIEAGEVGFLGTPWCTTQTTRSNVVTRNFPLRDQAATVSDLFMVTDVDLGLDWRFSRIATLSMGYRASHLFNSGRLDEIFRRSGEIEDAQGDITMDGVRVEMQFFPNIGEPVAPIEPEEAKYKEGRFLTRVGGFHTDLRGNQVTAAVSRPTGAASVLDADDSTTVDLLLGWETRRERRIYVTYWSYDSEEGASGAGGDFEPSLAPAVAFSQLFSTTDLTVIPRFADFQAGSEDELERWSLVWANPLKRTKHFQLDWRYGLAFVKYRRQLSAFYDDPTGLYQGKGFVIPGVGFPGLDVLGATVTARLDMESIGFGILSGINLRYAPARWLFLFLDANLSGMVGDTDDSFESRVHVMTNLGPPGDVLDTTALDLHTQGSNRLFTVIDAKAGVGVKVAGAFQIDAGWSFSNLLDALTERDSVADGVPATIFSSTDNLIVDGPFMGVSYNVYR